MTHRASPSQGARRITITVTTFARSPDRGRGLARDMPVRWALEEAGLSCDVRPLSFDQIKQPEHRARSPFSQIPTYEEGELTLFESGAIVFHIAERHGGLLPADPDARARAVAWMFAALATVEPPIVERSMTLLFDREKAGSTIACPSSTTACAPGSAISRRGLAIRNGSTETSAQAT